MYVFGINIPILELLVIFSTVVVAYLIILEIEFRQLRRLVNQFGRDEADLDKLVNDIRKIVGKKKK